MPKNNYFRNTDGSNTNEIDLVKDLFQESIQISGQELRYFPKEILVSNNVFGEDIYKFDKYYTLVCMLDNPTNVFDNAENLFDKFMYQSLRDLTFFISIKEFKEVLGVDFEEIGPPKIEDVIYIPFTEKFYQITYVTDESPKFPLGANIAWEIKAKHYEHSNDSINIEDNLLDTDIKSIISVGNNHSEEVKDGFEDFIDDYSILNNNLTPFGEI